MNIENISTEDLEKELNKRKSTPGIYNVISFVRDYREKSYSPPEFIHLIEKDGIQIECQLVGNIYDEILNDKQPTCSDEDPEWDDEWEEYEEFSKNYFIGKKVEIISFDPLTIKKIIT